MSVDTGHSNANNFQKGLKLANHNVTETEPYVKVCKITYKVIDFIALMGGKISQSWSLISLQCKDSAGFLEGFGLIGRIQELACPDDKGKYFLLTKPWKKRADRIFLTAASALKTIKFAAKFGFIALGSVAKVVIGRVPVFGLATDGLIVLSSFFSTWESKNQEVKESVNLANANEKIGKWANRTNEERTTLIKNVQDGDVGALDNLQQKYGNKAAALQKEITNAASGQKVQDLDKKKASLKKCQDRVNLIANKKFDELAESLSKCDVALKQKKWSLAKEKCTVARNKEWLSVASGVSKIFIIAMATSMTALGLATFPWIASLSALGIVVDSIGLAKCYYSYAHKA